MTRALRLGAGVLAVAFALTSAGCGVGACEDDLGWQVSPDDATIRVGEAVTVEASALGCGGTEPLAVEMRWISEDPSVASVGLRTGRVTGVAAGETRVRGQDSTYGSVWVSIEVVP